MTIKLKRKINLDDEVKEVEMTIIYKFFRGMNNDLFLEINHHCEHVIGFPRNYVVKLKEITNFFIRENDIENKEGISLIILGNNISYNLPSIEKTKNIILRIYDELKEVIKNGKLNNEKQEIEVKPYIINVPQIGNPNVYPDQNEKQWANTYNKYKEQYDKFKIIYEENKQKYNITKENYLQFFDYEDTWEDVVNAAIEQKHGLSMQS